MARPLLSPTEFASAVTAITSAFGDPTRREIYLFVHEQADGVTASEVAERFELHPNVARHHLDKLASGAYVDVSVERVAGSGAGRPSKRYRSGDREVSLEVSVRHDDVLIALLGKALSMLPTEQAEAMAEEVGAEFGRAMAGAITPKGSAAEAAGETTSTHRSFRAALHAVADALTAHGFAAHADNSGGELSIVAENCPFGGAAIEHPVICAVDRGMVKGMLETLVGEPAMTETALSLPKGDRRCVQTVT